MADGSIFSGIMGDMTSFGDALGGLLGGGGAKQVNIQQGDSSNAIYRSLMMENRLNSNKTQQPYGPQSFQAGKSQANPSVNMESVQNDWLQRLNRYATIPEVQGAKARTS